MRVCQKFRMQLSNPCPFSILCVTIFIVVKSTPLGRI